MSKNNAKDGRGWIASYMPKELASVTLYKSDCFYLIFEFEELLREGKAQIELLEKAISEAKQSLKRQQKELKQMAESIDFDKPLTLNDLLHNRTTQEYIDSLTEIDMIRAELENSKQILRQLKQGQTEIEYNIDYLKVKSKTNCIPSFDAYPVQETPEYKNEYAAYCERRYSEDIDFEDEEVEIKQNNNENKTVSFEEFIKKRESMNKN